MNVRDYRNRNKMRMNNIDPEEPMGPINPNPQEDITEDTDGTSTDGEQSNPYQDEKNCK